jgi:hypothetical protein
MVVTTSSSAPVASRSCSSWPATCQVAHLLAVVLRLRARQLQQRLLQREPRRAQQVLDREPGRDEQPAAGPAGSLGTRQGRLRLGGRPPARPPEAEIKPAGMEGIDQAEFLDRRQRGAVAHLDRS